jgi:hypothetical protein
LCNAVKLSSKNPVALDFQDTPTAASARAAAGEETREEEEGERHLGRGGHAGLEG